jgi:hypothetical protein
MMQQKLHEGVVKLRKIYEGFRLAILEIIRAVCQKLQNPRHRNPDLATEIRDRHQLSKRRAASNLRRAPWISKHRVPLTGDRRGEKRIARHR